MRSTDPTSRRFAAVLATMAAAALVGRVVFAAAWGFHADGTLSDAMNYHLLGQHLADGLGYIRAFDWAISHVKVPTAEFPPLFPMVLAGLHLAGVQTVHGQEIALAALGTVTVVLVGLLGREVAGPTAGLVGAGLAAAYPMLVLPDAALQAEGLYGLLVCLVLLLSLRWRGSRDAWSWLIVGAVVGLAALTRSEALLLLPLVVLWATRSWRAVLLAAVAAVVVLSPWVIRNAYALGELVPLSDNRGTLLVGANCRQSWQGPRQGLWTFACVDAIKSPNRDEIPLTHRYIQAGTDYARAHLSDAPRVGAVRVLRTFGLWAPRQQRTEEAAEGRNETALLVGWFAYLFVAAFAVGGTWIGYRRGMPVGPLLGAIVLVVITSALSYGNQRFRMAAEPSLLVLAGIGLSTLIGRLIGHRVPVAGDAVPDDPTGADVAVDDAWAR
ncbi:MAG TPA: glycosyltransferase family 39 protein [Acidimicrobiales bacterium]